MNPPEQDGSGPLRNSRSTASAGKGDRPTIAAEAATVAKSFPDRRPSPATMTIFGAAGDLTKRLIVPALYNLVRGGKLPDGFAVIGIDRNDETTEAWRQNLAEMTQAFARANDRKRGEAIDEQALSWLIRRMHYVRGDFTEPETYRRLGKLLTEQFGRHDGMANVLFYLAVADRFFGPIIEQLGRAALVRQSENAWRRVIVEKPFGHDFASAEALNAQILKVLSEDQIYRIDHFLGKETVQNILSCALPMASSSRCGTAIMWTTFRSQPPRRSASRVAVASTKKPARCGTWCPTISFSSLP